MLGDGSSYFHVFCTIISHKKDNCHFCEIWLYKTHFSSVAMNLPKKGSVASLLFNDKQVNSLIKLKSSQMMIDPLTKLRHFSKFMIKVLLILNSFANPCKLCLGFSLTRICRSSILTELGYSNWRESSREKFPQLKLAKPMFACLET